MITREKCREWKDHLVDVVYTQTRSEQQKDLEYINDTFLVDEIKEPHKTYRSGIGRKMVDAPAEEIVTANPQAFIRTKKDDIAERLSRETNSQIRLLQLQNPNIFKESVKNKLAKGESVIQLVHNKRWVVKPINRAGLPVLFLQPDPMITYCDPKEDDSGWLPNVGVPNRVVMFYQRTLLDVITRYPSWSNPKKRDLKKNSFVDWIEYWDKETHFIEIDGETIVHRPNPYGFVPFVRKFAGFGSKQESGDLSSLIMTDIRFSRDLIHEECVLRSNIASIHNLFAHRPRLITSPDVINEKDLRENLSFGAYDLNILAPFPLGAEIKQDDFEPPTLEMEQHLRDIKMEINQRCPFIMSGWPMGETGRQQQLAAMSAKKRYYTVVENTEQEFAVAMEMAFAICRKIPTLDKLPELNKNDLKTIFTCEIRLKAKDPIEEDRLHTLGSRHRQAGEIDLETLHTQYMGMTKDESKTVRAKLYVDMAMMNPAIQQLMAMQAAKEHGMEEALQMIQQGMLPGGTSPTGQQRLMGETQTQAGTEMGTQPNRGARFPPERFVRNPSESVV